MAVLSLSTFGTGSSGPRFQRQCEELPLPPPANSAGTAIPHLKNAVGMTFLLFILLFKVSYRMPRLALMAR
jgi:hypothetical protein